MGPLIKALNSYMDYIYTIAHTLLYLSYEIKHSLVLLFSRFRVIIDGPGSTTIQNGADRGIELLYTRANTFVSGTQLSPFTFYLLFMLIECDDHELLQL